MTVSNLPIQRIEIIGLHNDRDISLDFDAPIKILVDENGSGKTTFLNLLIGILQGDLQKIRRYDFESIEIVFSDTEKVSFKTPDFSILNFEDSDLKWELDAGDNSALGGAARPGTLKEKIQNILFQPARESLLQTVNSIKGLFPYEILYFPTYRLVEENLHTLGYEKSDIDSDTEQLIQFGMEDVRNQWTRVTDEMRNRSIDGFSQINGQMLNELTEEMYWNWFSIAVAVISQGKVDSEY